MYEYLAKIPMVPPLLYRIICTKKIVLMDATELISTRHDRLSFVTRYSKGLSLKLCIFHKQKGST